MQDRGPAFQTVVPSAVKDVRRTDGEGRTGHLDDSEEGPVIDGLVVQQPLLEVLLTEIARGEVVEATRSRHT